MQIQEHVPLAPMTTFGVGGEARFFTRVRTIDELTEAIAFAKEKNLPVFILGGGSNILVDDAGCNGLVVEIAFSGVEWNVESTHTLVVAAAGERWDRLVEAAIEKKLWGIENLSGIPGTVGGAVVQNIGAYGQALSQTLQWVEILDTVDGLVKNMNGNECIFGYRDSFFKHDDGRHIILRMALKLSSTPAPNLSYKDLAERFTDATPSIADIRNAVLEIRRNKFPDLAVEGTAGSFFKNPVLPDDEARKLLLRYPGMPLFSLPESSGMKIPLAWLLDHVLRMHGLRVGSARLFERQPLVIVAQKGSSSEDVKKLARMVIVSVQEKIGINIEPEVRFFSYHKDIHR